MDDLIASVYIEKLISSKLYEHLWQFDCRISQIIPEQDDISSFYFIDKNDNFWFEENLFEKMRKQSKNAVSFHSKYIDNPLSEGQIQIFKCDINNTINTVEPWLKALLNIITSNHRLGAPRKNYKTPNGSFIKIGSKHSIDNPNQGSLLDLLEEKENY